MKRGVSLLLLLGLLFTPLYGTSIKDKKDELSSNQQEIEEAKEKLESTTTKKEQLEIEIKKVDLQIVEIQENIADLAVQLVDKEAQIEESQKALDIAVEKKDVQYEATKARMVQMYKNQKNGYVQLILSSEDLWDAMNRLEYVKRISKQDNSLIDRYREQVEIIEVQKAEVEEEKNELSELQRVEITKKEELDSARSSKASTIAQLTTEEGKLTSEIEALEEASEELEAEIKRLLTAQTSYASNTKYTGGVFEWPVPGYYRLSSQYNPRTSPISGNYEFHTGIDIPASYGENVVAAADGVVITSGWVRGYGNTIMINHGGGLVTLYGHNSSLVVSNGQTVSKGQTVAKIGSTGYSTGNHCHFEVRVNGSHTSPWNYLNN